MSVKDCSPRLDVYAEVTDRIIAELEAGTVPWRRPWANVDGQVPRNLKSMKPYRGINLLLLSMSGYQSPFWLTFKQCSERGGKVRKGEKSTLIVFWKLTKIADPTAENGVKTIPLLKYYRVFSAEQCDGLTLPEIEPRAEFDPIAEAEAIVSGMPQAPAIQHGGDRACYVPGFDLVKMPPREAFEAAGGYYNTLLHELTHSTGHEARLNREGVAGAKIEFGSQCYSREELIAEMGAAMLCSVAGIRETIPASAAYIASWLRALKDDPKMLIAAAGKAQRAADFILGTSFETE